MNDHGDSSDAVSDAASGGVNRTVDDAAATGGMGGAQAAEAEPAAGRGVTPGRGRARRRRRVVALSPRDQARVARGQNPEDLARPDYEHDALSGPAEGLDAPAPGATGSNDARLRRDVPPHWG